MKKAKDALYSGKVGAKWPARRAPRIEPICLPVIEPGFRLNPGEPIFTIGSCFARNIEIVLKRAGFEVPALAFELPDNERYSGTKMASGVLNKYTPHSMLNEVMFAFGNSDGREFLIEIDDSLCFDEQLHANVPVTIERALERRAEIRSLYKDAVRRSRVVVVTLGLIESWWDSKNELFLNETPKKKVLELHPDRFFFKVLDIHETLVSVRDLILTLKANGHPDQKVLLTVSPVPIQRTFSGRDAITANTYSKSALRVAAEMTVSEFDWVDYYPSFESVTHTDRNLAWKDDLVHVTEEVIAANVERMVAAYS